ncbi:hypothetical protein [Roseiflexus sp.]|uniref:hypothetical protein n=1 Tax=Roseiflexus sp. TaxID=2562120 RepID=UPI00398A6269
MNVEKVHRYPRPFTITVEILSAIIVSIALTLLGRDLLRLLWSIYGLDTALFARFPWITDLVLVISDASAPPPEQPTDVLPALAWMALALMVALFLRNSMPTVRTSARGMLVAFVNDWLPVPWENIRTIKVTEAGDRYVLLVETDHGWLTGWHRWYSFIYRLGFRPAFLITSQISDFDELVKTLLSEADRAARTMAMERRVELQEEASSPLFRLLLSPSAFFAQRNVAPAAAGVSGDVVIGQYPRHISITLTWTAAFIAGAAILRYLTLVLTFLAITFPGVRSLPIIDQLDLRVLPAPWWLLIEAHIVLVFLLGVASFVYHALPAVEARSEGLIVHRLRGRLLVPWSHLRVMKVTEFSETSQMVLIQVAGGLPLDARFVSMLYDGSLSPGILITSAISNADTLLQRIALEAMRHHQATGDTGTAPFQSDARSDLLLLSVQSSAAVNRLVEESRNDPNTQGFTTERFVRVLPPALGLAAFSALMLFADRSFVQHILPDGRLAGAIVVMLLLALLEWPLVSFAAIAFDEMSGGGEDGLRPLYLYPPVQQPRLFLMLAALIVLLLGAQPLAALLWLSAIGWSFWLAAGLWSALYDWRGGQLIGGGLIPVVFQLLLLIGYLVVRA